MAGKLKHNGHLSTNKDLNTLIRDAVAAGWDAEATKNNHIKLTATNGQFVFCSQSPKDRRAIENIRKEMQRANPGWDSKKDDKPTATTAMAAIATAKKPRDVMNAAAKKPSAKATPARAADRTGTTLR